MKDYSAAFANTTGGVFPNTLGVNASGPSATDGTEFVKLMIDDIWGARQDLMVEAGKTPSGNDEAVGSSDFVAALKSLLWFNNLITGLVPSNNVTDSDHDIDVSVGQAMDSTNAFLMKLTSGLIKQIDASWAVGTNAGGLFTGTVAADTWYAVFAIRADADGSVDAGFDTSPVAANIPGGYTAFRRIGWVLTDSSANILAFHSTEKSGGDISYEWDAIAQDHNSTAAITARTLITISAPIDSVATVVFNYGNLAADFATIQSVATTDTAPSVNNFTHSVDAASAQSTSEFSVKVDSSSQLAVRSAADNAAFSKIVNTLGFTDNR